MREKIVKLNLKFKILCVKGHYQESKKTTHRMEENTYESYIQSGINIQSIKDLLQPKKKKISHLKKWAKDLNRHFLQDRWPKGT